MDFTWYIRKLPFTSWHPHIYTLVRVHQQTIHEYRYCKRRPFVSRARAQQVLEIKRLAQLAEVGVEPSTVYAILTDYPTSK